MGKIIVVDNPLDLSQRAEYQHAGPFIDFLLERYPSGFGGPHVASLNLKCFAVADYDTPMGDDDVVVLAIKGPLAWSGHGGVLMVPPLL